MCLFGRKQWRRLVVLAIVGIALALSLLAVRPVVFANASPPNASTPSSTGTERATALLQTVLGGGRALSARQHSYSNISPSALSAVSYPVPVVAATASARPGEVSMRVTGTMTLTLATPVDAGRCAFARTVGSAPQFAIVATAQCRAMGAPARGWMSQ